MKKRMTPEEEKELAEHIKAIGKILYKQTKPEQVDTQRVRADRRASARLGGNASAQKSKKQLESKC